MSYEDAIQKAEALKREAIARIRGYVEKTGIARSRLAQGAGLSINALRDLHDEKWSPEPATILALERFIAEHPPAEDGPQSTGAAA